MSFRLLSASSEDDPETLVRSAARDHIPVNPNHANEETEPQAVPPQPKPVPDSVERESIDTILAEITASETYKEQIVHRRVFEEQEGRIGKHSPGLQTTRNFIDVLQGSLAVPITEAIREALLASRQISSFYTHQAAAIDAVGEGKHVIVSTSTASGKSVIYQVCGDR